MECALEYKGPAEALGFGYVGGCLDEFSEASLVTGWASMKNGSRLFANGPRRRLETLFESGAHEERSAVERIIPR